MNTFLTGFIFGWLATGAFNWFVLWLFYRGFFGWLCDFVIPKIGFEDDDDEYF